MSIGLAIPLDGRMEPIGRQIEVGARAAIDSLNPEATLVVENTQCDTQTGASTAEAFVQKKVDVVIGFVCIEALEAAFPALGDAHIPVITPVVRETVKIGSSTQDGQNLFHLTVLSKDLVTNVGTLLSRRWRTEPFAVVDDGTIYGRQLAQNLVHTAQGRGLKPVYTETFRPQQENLLPLARRLERSGATHVFVGAGRSDIAILQRDAASIGYNVEVAGGEALRDSDLDVALSENALMVGVPVSEEWLSRQTRTDWITQYPQLENLLRSGQTIEGYVFPAYAAAEVAITAYLLTGSNRNLSTTLNGTRFNTILGPVSFGENGVINAKLTHVLRYDGNQFVIDTEN